MTTIVLEQEYFINVVTTLPILSGYYHYYFCSILVLVHSVVIWSRIQARELNQLGHIIHYSALSLSGTTKS